MPSCGCRYHRSVHQCHHQHHSNATLTTEHHHFVCSLPVQQCSSECFKIHFNFILRSRTWFFCSLSLAISPFSLSFSVTASHLHSRNAMRHDKNESNVSKKQEMLAKVHFGRQQSEHKNESVRKNKNLSPKKIHRFIISFHFVFVPCSRHSTIFPFPYTFAVAFFPVRFHALLSKSRIAFDTFYLSE